MTRRSPAWRAMDELYRHVHSCPNCADVGLRRLCLVRKGLALRLIAACADQLAAGDNQG